MPDEENQIDLDALKLGMRNSGKDSQRLQTIHDLAVENGATCGEPGSKSVGPDSIVFGDAIKATEDGHITGYLVRFGSPEQTDVSAERDYFTAETDFGFGESKTMRTPVYFNHRLPLKTRNGGQVHVKERIGEGDITLTDDGVLIDAVLYNHERYKKALNYLGWSSGTATHLTDRKAVGSAHHVTAWPLGLDASVTPMPAEPRNSVLPLKSLSETTLETDLEGGDAPEAQSAATKSITPNKDNIMEITEEKLQEIVSQAVKTGAEQALKSLPAEPQPVKAGGVEVTHDPADNPFTGLGEFCAAVKAAAVAPYNRPDVRLSRLEVKGGTGANETVPSEGGFTLEPTLQSSILMPTHETGPFSSAATKLPVGANSNYGWINGVDETSRATGSRWGGIQGYRLGEGATKTGSKPAFRRINWELKKYAVLVYATDELLQDSAQFSEVVRIGAGEEISFMVNDDLLNGLGAFGPKGILGSTAYVSVAKEDSQTADTIVFENISKMWRRMASRNKAKATWYINQDVGSQLDQLSIVAGTAALEARFISWGPDGVMRMYGRPVIETEFNATLGDLGDIVLADMSEYLYWEKGGVQAASSIHVQFLTDEQVFRFVYRADGQPSISVPLTPYKGTNTLSPFVTLAERA